LQTSINRIGAPDFDVDAMAEVLLSSAIGLNIFIRAAASNAARRPMAHATAKLVRGWANA
ncbi:MAG: hypothetical protein COA52_14290, partial [Hyphomicrobiales bacterium]